MNIVYIHKAKFHKRPPVISTVSILNDLGHKVILIDEGISDYWKEILTKRQVTFYEIPRPKMKLNKLSSIIHYGLFRHKVNRILKSISLSQESFILWIEGAYTFVSLGKIIKKYKYVLQIQELHDNKKYQLNAIRKIINDASAVCMPEYNRAAIYRAWFNLNKTPYVLPNKPYFIPSIDTLKQNNDFTQYSNLFFSKKVILYQGLLIEERKLDAFIEAVRKLGDEYQFVLMGKDYGMVSRYKSIDQNIVHIEYIPAPYYLYYTSLCHIGIISYSPNMLNTTFCAPNKLYEYAAFSKPMIGNDIPGLQIIKDNRAGILVDECDSDAIFDAIKIISNNYDLYSKAAKLLYDNTDNKSIINKVVSSIEK